MTIEVGQDEFVLIRQAGVSSDVYRTKNVADCYVFGISFSGSGGDQALFGHFSQNYFKGSGSLQPNGSFNTMLSHLEGQTNIKVEALTNFQAGTRDSIKHIREALGKYGDTDTAKFYLATLDQPYVDVYFIPHTWTLVADYKGYGTEGIEDFKRRTSHDTPRFATAFGDGPSKAAKTGCCVIL